MEIKKQSITQLIHDYKQQEDELIQKQYKNARNYLNYYQEKNLSNQFPDFDKDLLKDPHWLKLASLESDSILVERDKLSIPFIQATKDEAENITVNYYLYRGMFKHVIEKGNQGSLTHTGNTYLEETHKILGFTYSPKMTVIDGQLHHSINTRNQSKTAHLGYQFQQKTHTVPVKSSTYLFKALKTTTQSFIRSNSPSDFVEYIIQFFQQFFPFEHGMVYIEPDQYDILKEWATAYLDMEINKFERLHDNLIHNPYFDNLETFDAFTQPLIQSVVQRTKQHQRYGFATNVLTDLDDQHLAMVRITGYGGEAQRLYDHLKSKVDHDIDNFQVVDILIIDRETLTINDILCHRYNEQANARSLKLATANQTQNITDAFYKNAVNLHQPILKDDFYISGHMNRSLGEILKLSQSLHTTTYENVNNIVDHFIQSVIIKNHLKLLPAIEKVFKAHHSIGLYVMKEFLGEKYPYYNQNNTGIYLNEETNNIYQAFFHYPKEYVKFMMDTLGNQLKSHQEINDELRLFKLLSLGNPNPTEYAALYEKAQLFNQPIALLNKLHHQFGEHLAHIPTKYLKRTLDYLYYLKTEEYITNEDELFILWRDTLNAASELQYDLQNRDHLYPKMLRFQHDKLTHLVTLYADRIANERVANHARTDLEIEGETFTIIAPRTTQELIDEGIQLGHCVGSYTDAVSNGRTHILFLRHNDDINKPLYTIEVKENRIIQANGLYNTPITRCQDEKIIQFFENWKKDHQLTA